nr:MAG TPA: hypothetical protein [Caudoviricetes sp.]
MYIIISERIEWHNMLCYKNNQTLYIVFWN